MRVFVDGQALQTGSAGDDVRSLLRALGGFRSGWEWSFVEADFLPPVAAELPASVRRLTFQPPRPVKPFDRRDGRVNEHYYGDWLTARGVDVLVVPHFFDPATVVPRFAGPRPVVLGLVRDLGPLGRAEACARDPEAWRWYCSRLRALLDADTLLVSSPGAERELRELLPERPARIVVADNLAAALGDAAAVRSPAVPRVPKRIAWVSPLPPVSSGIADYSADLLPSLARHFEIDLVIDPQQPTVAPALAARHLTLTSAEAVQRHRVRPYDLFVYHVGNSGHHVYMLELMRRFRGLVVLHDFHLSGFVAVSRQRGLWPTTVEEELEFEGETHLVEWKRGGHVSEAALRQLAAENTRLLGLADAVLVHSAWTWQRVRRLVDVPVARVRHLMAVTPRVDALVRRRELGLPADAFVVCSLGHHGHTKRMHSLLRAAAGVRAALRRRIQVVLVGSMPPLDQENLRRFAATLGMGSQLQLTGYVSMTEFNAYIQAADVCVQLRYPTNGETSGSVLRALAAGTAVITSDQGPMAELPDDAVGKVRTPQFEGRDLTALLEQLAADPARRASLAAAGQRYVARQLDPALSAAGYAALIEQTIARRRERDANWHEATAALLLDGTLAAGPERDRLVRDWAELRDRALRPAVRPAKPPARKAG